MRDEKLANQGAPINGGAYYASIEEMSQPRHQVIQKLLLAMSSKKTKVFASTLKEVEEAGWDISRLVVQDSVGSWYTLGAFLCSRPNQSYGRLCLEYLNYLGVDVKSQEGQTHSSLARWLRRDTPGAEQALDAIKENVRQPISHIFMRQWGSYLPEREAPSSATKDYLQYDYKQYVKRQEIAKKIFQKLTDLGVDWTQKDEYGNTLCHVLVEGHSTVALKFLLPWLKTLGVSMSDANADGLFPADVAKLRVERNNAKKYGANDNKEVAAFKEVIAKMESELLSASTPRAASSAPSRMRL